MKRFSKWAVLMGMLALLATPLVFGAAVNAHVRNGSEWVKGIIYAGTSGVAITDATGNLATTSGTYSGNVGVSGTLGVTGAATLRSTLAVTGTSALSGAVTTTSTLGVGGALAVTGTSALSGAVTMTSTLGVGGALGVTGAVTLRDDELLLTSVSADGTASTHSAQGTTGPSGLISTLVTHAATVGTNGDSYTLPDSAIGEVRLVCNAAAANNMDVFPFTSDSINKESANTAINLVAGECALCFKVTAVKWGCVIGVAN